jgi:hypothetical protein
MPKTYRRLDPLKNVTNLSITLGIVITQKTSFMDDYIHQYP